MATIQRGNILPSGTRFYGDFLTFGDLRGGSARVRLHRAKRRTTWLEGALRRPRLARSFSSTPTTVWRSGWVITSCAAPSLPSSTSCSPSCSETRVLIYHHVARRGTALDQVNGRLTQIEDRLGRRAFALLYHRGSARAFFVVPAQRHWEALSSRARVFLESPWAQHFEIVGSA